MGAEVTAFSRTLAKRDDSLKLSATGYVAAGRRRQKKLRSTFDIIVSTISDSVELDTPHRPHPAAWRGRQPGLPSDGKATMASSASSTATA